MKSIERIIYLLVMILSISLYSATPKESKYKLGFCYNSFYKEYYPQPPLSMTEQIKIFKEKANSYDAINISEENDNYHKDTNTRLDQVFQIKNRGKLLGNRIFCSFFILSSFLVLTEIFLQAKGSFFFSPSDGLDYCHILVVRHGDKYPNGSLAPIGWTRARYIANCLKDLSDGKKENYHIKWSIGVYATDPYDSSMRPIKTAQISAHTLGLNQVITLKSGARGADELKQKLLSEPKGICHRASKKSPYLAIVISEHNQITFFLEQLGLIANKEERGQYFGDENARELLKSSSKYLFENDSKLHWPSTCYVAGLNQAEIDNKGTSNCFNRAILLEDMKVLKHYEESHEGSTHYLPKDEGFVGDEIGSCEGVFHYLEEKYWTNKTHDYYHF